ncbi:MAG: ABC transporter substrate-binding protein [Thermomicrobiales bacterium]|nr:ABC transporter substrate-binding protein [Thermomicrobiales bacterium]
MQHLHLNRRRLLQAAGLAAIVPHFAAAEGTKVSLALDWYPNANHAGIYMALANGYFEAAGITPDVFVPADATTVLQTVGAGRDTFGISYQNDVLVARENGVPIQSIAAITQHPLNSLMVLESSDIQSPADLKGKTVAMVGVPTDEAYLSTILKSVDLTMDDVETINVGYDLLPALFSGNADALIGVYWSHETILAEQEGYPVRYFRIEDFGVPDYYELVIVAGEKTITEQPEMVSAFLGGLRQGYTDAAADPAAALEQLIAASPDLEVDVERQGLDLLKPVWTSDGTVAWGTQTAERWDAFTAWAQENDLLDESVVAADAWVDKF